MKHLNEYLMSEEDYVEHMIAKMMAEKTINEAGRRKKSTVKQVATEEGVAMVDAMTTGSEAEAKAAEDNFNKVIYHNGPTIYAFTTDKVDEPIKIGYTDQLPQRRIEQWRKKYMMGKDDDPEESVHCIGYWSAEEVMNADLESNTGELVFFWDSAVHKHVRDYGGAGNGWRQLNKEEFRNKLTGKGACIRCDE